MKATSFAAFTLMAVLPFATASNPEYYDQQFVMSPFGSEDSLQNQYMKELFEVPENPWYKGGDGPAHNHRHGKALGHNKQGHQQASQSYERQHPSSRVEWQDSHNVDADIGYGLLYEELERKPRGYGHSENFIHKSQEVQSFNYQPGHNNKQEQRSYHGAPVSQPRQQKPYHKRQWANNSDTQWRYAPDNSSDQQSSYDGPRGQPIHNREGKNLRDVLAKYSDQKRPEYGPPPRPQHPPASQQQSYSGPQHAPPQHPHQKQYPGPPQPDSHQLPYSGQTNQIQHPEQPHYSIEPAPQNQPPQPPNYQLPQHPQQQPKPSLPPNPYKEFGDPEQYKQWKKDQHERAPPSPPKAAPSGGQNPYSQQQQQQEHHHSSQNLRNLYQQQYPEQQPKNPYHDQLHPGQRPDNHNPYQPQQHPVEKPRIPFEHQTEHQKQWLFDQNPWGSNNSYQHQNQHAVPNGVQHPNHHQSNHGSSHGEPKSPPKKTETKKESHEMPDHDHVHDHPELADMLMQLQALMPVENHFSTNDAEIELQKDFNNLVGEPWCVPAGHTIDLQLQVTTAKGASVLTLVKNDIPVATSSSTLMASQAASMSLIYKSEIEEDSKFAVMIFTTELENDIDPLNMQLSYKLFGSAVKVTNDLPQCASNASELDD